MLSILDAYTEVLPPTKTYGRRSLCWIPVDLHHPEADGRLGNLSIKLEHAKSGWGRNVECDTYAIERDTPLPGDNGGVAYWLQNLTDPEQEQPYRAVLGGLNRLPSCTCTAGKCRVPGEPDVTDGCKHRDALAHLIQEGFLKGSEVVENGHNVTTNAPQNGNEPSRLREAPEGGRAQPLDSIPASRRLAPNGHPMAGRQYAHLGAEPATHLGSPDQVTDFDQTDLDATVHDAQDELCIMHT